MSSPTPTTHELPVSLPEALLALAAERERVIELERERDQLRASHERLRLELELLKRRIYLAKAERVDTRQLELEFVQLLAQLDRLAGTTPEKQRTEGAEKAPAPRTVSTGRRDLRRLALEEERVELPDPVFEAMVAEGKAERFGFEESCKLAFQRGAWRRLVVARVKYRALDQDGTSHLATTPMPPECFPRSLAAPSALAHVVTDKLCDGLPLHRIESRAAREGVELDRGTMCRWLEEAGGTVGPTVVAAMRQEALEKAFCIATDATGIHVQPERRADGARQPCRKGHYFVLVADRDHVLFEYAAKETSAFVAEMLKGFKGYVQADAKNVYDVLFREPKKPPDDPAKKTEVGCWTHCRRGFWEAAVCLKSEVAREGLVRIGRIFALDDAWRGRSPADIHRLRGEHLRPHLDSFFAWAEAEHEKVQKVRGLLRSALGYAVRQKEALRVVLDDGRLVLENNRSERALRKVAMGRKAWLFVGSDWHAQSAANLLPLVASARLHDVEPESYLRDLFRVLAHWPRERYLELAPKYWAATRARLDPAELALEIGPLTVPPPLADAPAEKPPPG